MKLDFNEDENYISFDKLNAGDTFYLDFECYMKCSDIKSDSENINAVNLKTGYLTFIDSYVSVRSLKLKVVRDCVEGRCINDTSK